MTKGTLISGQAGRPARAILRQTTGNYTYNHEAGATSIRIEHELHRITARTHRSLRFADVGSLSTLGVDARRYANFHYSITQAIAAAAFFLDFDGLIVPSARSTDLKPVIFTEKLSLGEPLEIEASEPVDWSTWRSQHRLRSRGNE